MTAASPAITLQVRDRDKVMEPYTRRDRPSTDTARVTTRKISF
jgi:hypothetical protein